MFEKKCICEGEKSSNLVYVRENEVPICYVKTLQQNEISSWYLILYPKLLFLFIIIRNIFTEIASNFFCECVVVSYSLF